VAAIALHASVAAADAPVYPSGKLVRAADERAVIVWERGRRVEHVIRQLDVEGEAPAFATLVATPSAPKVAKVKDDIFGRVAALVADVVPPAPADGAALPKSKVDDFEVMSVKATDGAAINDWLAKNKLEMRPAVSAWLQKAAAKGWTVTALRYSGVPAGARVVHTPTVRMTFDTETPIYPYAEAPPTRGEQQDFSSSHTGFRSTNATRALDVWFIGEDAMAAYQRVVPSNPPPYGVGHVNDGALATALGDTKSWGLDPHAFHDWTLTHFHEAGIRFAVEDISFRPQDERAHTAFAGDAGDGAVEPAAAPASTAVTPPPRPSRSALAARPAHGTRATAHPAALHKTRARRFVFGIAALALLAGLVFAGSELRSRRGG